MDCRVRPGNDRVERQALAAGPAISVFRLFVAGGVRLFRIEMPQGWPLPLPFGERIGVRGSRILVRL
jgi:hypothetical protein